MGVIFEHRLPIIFISTYEIALGWMPQNTFDEIKFSLGNQPLPEPMFGQVISAYGVTKPKRAKYITALLYNHKYKPKYYDTRPFWVQTSM